MRGLYLVLCCTVISKVWCLKPFSNESPLEAMQNIRFASKTFSPSLEEEAEKEEIIEESEKTKDEAKDVIKKIEDIQDTPVKNNKLPESQREKVKLIAEAKMMEASLGQQEITMNDGSESVENASLDSAIDAKIKDPKARATRAIRAEVEAAKGAELVKKGIESRKKSEEALEDLQRHAK